MLDREHLERVHVRYGCGLYAPSRLGGPFSCSPRSFGGRVERRRLCARARRVEIFLGEGNLYPCSMQAIACTAAKLLEIE